MKKMNKDQSIQTEIDAFYIYARLAENEKDPVLAEVFKGLSEIEKAHAEGFIKSSGKVKDLRPSLQARALNRIGKIFGYDYVLGVMLDTEKRLADAVIKSKSKEKMALSGQERNHVKIMEGMVSKGTAVTGRQMSRFERRHRSLGGNALRAAVLGGNDGLVSNFSLVMGVAGAAGAGKEVILAGSAGLLAGALSMALGEWISVKSSQELTENQVQLEREELEDHPELEQKELELIYRAKGMDKTTAISMAAEAFKDKEKALDILVQEELSIDLSEIEGSAMEAAVYSFMLFAIGAIIPLLPFFFFSGKTAIIMSAGASAMGLALIGGAITLFTGKSLWYSAGRQVVFGLLAAAVTFGIGHLIGFAV